MKMKLQIQIAWIGAEYGKRGIRFANPLQLDFFPQLIQPATGEFYACPSYQYFLAMGTP